MTRRLAFLFAAVVASTALAASSGVTNEDNQRYSYEIQCGGSISRGTFNHGHNAWSGSVEGCKLKVQGAGSATISNRSACTIKNRMLDCD